MIFLLNPFLLAAAICILCGEHDRSLSYLEASLSSDLGQAGSTLPDVLAVGLLLRARAYAALGKRAEAAASFESSANMADRYQLWLLKALALRDFKLLILDEMGHGDHASRQLGAVLRLLTGPVESLTTFMKGMDAAELMQLSPPEPGYQIVY